MPVSAVSGERRFAAEPAITRKLNQVDSVLPADGWRPARRAGAYPRPRISVKGTSTDYADFTDRKTTTGMSVGGVEFDSRSRPPPSERAYAYCLLLLRLYNLRNLCNLWMQT